MTFQPLHALRPFLPALLLVFGTGALSCRATSTYESEGDRLMAEAKFKDALEAYRHAEGSGRVGDVSLAAKLKDAYIASRIEEGRLLLVQHEHLKAVEVFQEVAVLAPNSDTAKQWLLKAERDYSRRLLEDGKDRLSVREYESAIALFEKSLRYDPDNGEAKDALARAKEILKWRQDKGQAQWKGGLRAFQQGDTYVAETDVANAASILPGLPHAEAMLEDLHRSMGNDRHQLAVKLENKGQWHAAERVYRQAKLLKTSAPGVEASEERMQKEVKADDLVRSAQQSVARGEFDLAEKKLAAARELTTDAQNTAAIETRLHELSEKRSESEYKDALALELEGSVEEAIDAYRAMDKKYPAYRDVRERIDKLQLQVLAPAKTAYAEAKDALAKGELERAQSKLKAVIFLHPFYLDARELLKSVEKEIAARKK